MDLELRGRVALITGPAKGMGAAVSLAFAAEGCRMALLARDTDAVAPVGREIEAAGGEAIVVACDVTDGEGCEAAAKAAVARFGDHRHPRQRRGRQRPDRQDRRHHPARPSSATSSTSTWPARST